MSPTISVIVPVYNVEKYLPKCLNSIVNQIYKNFELILINDGSRDNSGKICDDYKKKHHFIKVLHTENSGANNARNKGLDIATGKYIAFVDSDDWVEENFLQDFVDNLTDDSTLLVQDKFRDNLQKSEVNYFGFKNEVYTLKTEFGQMILNNKFHVPGGYNWNKLYAKNIIDNHKIRFDENHHIGEDEKWNFDYLKKINSIKYIAKSNYHYNYNPSSLSNKPRSLKIETARFLFRTNFYKYAFKNYILTDEGKKSIINEIESFFRICIFDRIYKDKLSKSERLERLKTICKLPKEDLYFLKSDLKFRNIDYFLIKNDCPYILDFFKTLRLKINQ